MTELGPAASRLCVATAADRSEPLRSIQKSAGYYRLHLTTDPADGAEFAVAAPGMDEPSLISDLITALRSQVMRGLGSTRPVVAGFHVGIIKVSGSSFGGIGVERALALIRNPAITAQAAQWHPGHSDTGKVRLAVAITSNLFEDLRAEGLPGTEWQQVPAAGAWLRTFSSR